MLPKNRNHSLVLATILPLLALSSWPLDKAVIIEQRATGLAVFNLTNQPIYCAAFKVGTVYRSGWRPCDHPDVCPEYTALPGLTARLPYVDIYFWLPGTDVMVYWWHLTPDAAREHGYRVVDLTEQIVATPVVPIFPDD